jgi:hypothetical protein
MTATARLISGNRLHLQHGPIDLIIGADGATAEIERAYRVAWKAFPSILPALVAKLPMLRTAVGADASDFARSIPSTLALPLKGGGEENGEEAGVEFANNLYPAGEFANNLYQSAHLSSDILPPSPLEGEGRGGGSQRNSSRQITPRLTRQFRFIAKRNKSSRAFLPLKGGGKRRSVFHSIMHPGRPP